MCDDKRTCWPPLTKIFCFDVSCHTALASRLNLIQTSEANIRSSFGVSSSMEGIFAARS